MRRLMIFIALMAAVGMAHSEAVPNAGTSDKRIKTIDYDPNQVVLIVGREGYATDVRLNDDEKITHVAIGNADAWQVAPVEQHLILKPKTSDAKTNAIVLTDKHRVYNMLLTTAEAKAKGPGGGDDQYFQIEFRYPAEVKAKADQARAVDNVRDQLAHPKRVVRNPNYFACGDKAVTPDQAFDDGRFTYLRYAGNRAMPAVYSVADDGSEQIVNRDVDADSPDTIVLHQIAKKLVFRMGNMVGCVVNKSYDPKGVANFNGTVAPNIERVIKGGQVQ